MLLHLGVYYFSHLQYYLYQIMDPSSILHCRPKNFESRQNSQYE